AAGDESLESWAARVLAGARDAHRVWLAGIVGGDTPGKIGRPTGAVTALGPQQLPQQLGRAATLPAPIAPARIAHDDQPPEPGASTHLSASSSASENDELDHLPRRSYALPILLAIVVLLVIGTGTLVAKHKPGEAFLQVLVDGRYAGDTPLKRSFPAGPHTVELIAPDTKAVVRSEQVELANGQTITVQP